MRAENGHPEPFNLKAMEVGNEEKKLEDYAEHYELITSLIWKYNPEMNIIGSGRWTTDNMTGNPCVSG